MAAPHGLRRTVGTSLIPHSSLCLAHPRPRPHLVSSQSRGARVDHCRWAKPLGVRLLRVRRLALHARMVPLHDHLHHRGLRRRVHPDRHWQARRHLPHPLLVITSHHSPHRSRTALATLTLRSRTAHAPLTPRNAHTALSSPLTRARARIALTLDASRAHCL